MISNDIFVRAFENLRAGVLLLEKATGRVMEANPAFLRMCGRPRSGVVGRSFWAPPLIDDAEAGAEVFEHLRAGGRGEGNDTVGAISDGADAVIGDVVEVEFTLAGTTDAKYHASAPTGTMPSSASALSLR